MPKTLEEQFQSAKEHAVMWHMKVLALEDELAQYRRAHDEVLKLTKENQDLREELARVTATPVRKCSAHDAIRYILDMLDGSDPYDPGEWNPTVYLSQKHHPDIED